MACDTLSDAAPLGDAVQIQKSEVLRIGLCGIGRTGFGRIRRETSASQHCRILAGFDLIPERAEQLKQVCGASIHHSYESMLRDPQIELVIIATRSHHHAEMAIEALEANKHVIVEKPMATHLADADRMIAAAQRSRGKLIVRHNRRFDPAFVAARRVVLSGKLGSLSLLRIRHHEYVRRNDWQTLSEFGGGQLLNWGPHLIDWALRLSDSTATQVWCDSRRLAAGGDAEDHVKLIIKMQSGCVADIEMSGAEALPEPLMHISGSRGAMVIDQDQLRLRYLPEDFELASTDTSQTPQQDNRPRVDEPPWIEQHQPLPSADPGQFWNEAYRWVRLGIPFPVTLEQARETMRVIELAKLQSPGSVSG